jgi:hypothetical protein
MQPNPNRSSLSFSFPLFIGLVFGVGILHVLSLSFVTEDKFDELALGQGTTGYFANVDEVQVHCGDLNDANLCIDNYKNLSSKENVTLWLGNSQLHAINQKKPGDVTASAILHRVAKINSKYLLTFSQANASLQEHYLLFEYLSQKIPVTILILPVVFDDLRETGIRPSLIDAFNNHAVSVRLNNTEIGNKMLAVHRSQDASGNDMAALEDTVQENSEKYLNTKLEKIWDIWEKRSTFRGNFLENLYLFRNSVFGINPSSIRRMIPGRYIMNMDALKATVQSANEQGIKVILYITPLRNDVKVPYDLEDYVKFKSELKLISQKYEARFVNFERLIPANLWGAKNATTLGGGYELDFMHFKAGGHELLAQALYDELIMIGEDSK